MERAKLVV